MGYISQFEASDIDSDDIDLRFEVDAVETGTTVSIVDECGHAAQIITALLDELEHYKSREERVTKLVMDNSTSWDALYKKLEAAEKRIAELDKRLIEYAGIATREAHRVAELEARTVILPEPIIVLHRRDFTDAHREIYAYPEAEVNAALADAGIGVKGE
ncbi:TPA: ead/Ea22-like family protein [Salmonella enterica]|uniref:Ead/Ea22-like family protein n=1 Tax=Salmonella enterica TaxID=28901 RepID=A0A742KK47_SALER|nr:ead/Ea22-like family protein [Salmonella enterica subsp. enterica serovar Schwarzengrund]EBW5625023.1 ead/Ea22-like family protein [Salmonella enterica subsp. enterica serovar Mbandaka]EDA5766157.1 ead/Ea22-like family protein [Salmonella enterica subsp. enterica serovar Kalamu]EEJ6900749.1 ead/Ea22-like family protein [Salmonella enterica subsp. enterica serovar Bredeney]HAF1394137.1 ead/Ea22-like family protein [Salmonella enterica]